MNITTQELENIIEGLKTACEKCESFMIIARGRKICRKCAAKKAIETANRIKNRNGAAENKIEVIIQLMNGKEKRYLVSKLVFDGHFYTAHYSVIRNGRHIPQKTTIDNATAKIAIDGEPVNMKSGDQKP